MAARVALQCFVALGMAFSASAAEGNTAPAPQVNGPAENFENPAALSFDDLVALLPQPSRKEIWRHGSIRY